MKVLFVVTAYPRHEGDVITPWMGETIERLRQRGTAVEVLAPSYRGAGRGAELVNGVRVHRFRYAPSRIETLTHDMPALERIARNPMFAALLPSYVAAGIAAASKVARDGRFDVVHAFWPIPHGLFALAAKRASGAAVVSTFFSAELNWRGMTRTLVAPLLRRIVAGSDAVTVISSYTGERLREYIPGAEIVVIPFGAAVEGRSSDLGASVAPARRTKDPFELLFVGRLVRRKGVAVLLRAAALLAADRRLHVRIVGGGPEKEALLSEASRLGVSDQITFDGVVDSERLDDILRRCDALVLPAIVTETGDTEGLGVVLIEAMGYGKPVIASAAGGIVDIVRDGDTGILVPPGDASALANAITGAMDHPAELAAIADRGRAYAETEFSWDAIVSRLLHVYDSVVAKRASGNTGENERSG